MKGLTVADQRGIEHFRQAMASILLEHEVEALWLKICWLKKAKSFDWRCGEVAATVGASVAYMSVRRNFFPCVTPRMAYSILRNGPKGVDAMMLLAMLLNSSLPVLVKASRLSSMPCMAFCVADWTTEKVSLYR